MNSSKSYGPKCVRLRVHSTTPICANRADIPSPCYGLNGMIQRINSFNASFVPPTVRRQTTEPFQNGNLPNRFYVRNLGHF